jgi:hypothetical protein
MEKNLNYYRKGGTQGAMSFVVVTNKTQKKGKYHCLTMSGTVFWQLT